MAPAALPDENGEASGEAPEGGGEDEEENRDVTCELCGKDFLDTVIAFHLEKAHGDCPNLAEVSGEAFRVIHI